jgi:hypothetical protein
MGATIPFEVASRQALTTTAAMLRSMNISNKRVIIPRWGRGGPGSYSKRLALLSLESRPLVLTLIGHPASGLLENRDVYCVSRELVVGMDDRPAKNE